MIFKVLTTLALVAGAANAAQNQLQQVTNFGSNPTGAGMYVYTPSKLANPLPLIVAIHYCSGTAQAYFSGTQYANLADQYGFIVIYPNSPNSGGCWDVHTNATLTHNAGGDSLGIASMARYAISTYGVSPNHVYATGSSSGAMMTNVLMGAYPDLFLAGVGFSGVPYGCFGGANMWNTACAEGQLIETPQYWGDLVRSGYPGFTGTRPKIQFWHGTADTTLYPQNFWEEIKQWTNVFGVSQTPATNTTNDPLTGYSWATFGPNVVAVLGQGVGHPVPVQEASVLQWFGITASTSSGSPTTTAAAAPTSTAGTVARYGQCGGTGYTGPTTCAAPYTCQEQSAYYYQCL